MAGLARFTVRFRIPIIALTVVFMIVAAVVGGGAFGVLKGGGFEVPGSESTRAADLLASEFGGGEPNLVLVLTAEGRNVDDPALATAGADIATRLAGMAGVEQVATYWSLGSQPTLRSGDGDTALAFAWIAGDEDVSADHAAAIMTAFEGEQGPFQVLPGGALAVGVDINHTIESDLLRAELIAIPLTLLLLLFVFRGLVAASLPLLVGIIAILGTLLNLFIVGSFTNASIFAINLATALGLGLGIDYSLLIVSRFRDELAAGRGVEEAVERTLATAGRTVLVSALTVAVSLSALLVFPLYFLRSFAYAGVAVVLLALAASILTLPALLALLGRRIDALRIGRPRAARELHTGFWYRTANTVMRRPILFAASATTFLLLLGYPFLHVEFGSPDDRVLTTSAVSRQAGDILRQDFDGNATESFAVIADGVSAADADMIAPGAADISRMPGVARVESAAGTFVDGEMVAPAPIAERFAARSGAPVTWMSVVPAFPAVSAEGEALVREIRALPLPYPVLVGGAAADLVDLKDGIANALPLAFAIIILATFALLFLLSGSLLVPVKALALNTLSLTATFGAMVWIFQDGNLSGLLDFTATGTLETSMPILMFCVAFGLSMDYEVFLLSRIKEEYDHSGNNESAVALGLERTGRLVTAAALLVSITFFAFGTSSVSFMKMFGIGLGIAVLMDATIVRGLLVPAFMRLAGDANWWAPAPLRRFHDRYGVRESDTPAA